MALVTPPPGLVVIDGDITALEAVIEKGVSVHLYVNNQLPTRSARLGDYSALALPGYAPAHLARQLLSWTVERGEPSRAVYNTEIEFIFGSEAPLIYGALLVVNGRLFGVQPLVKPFEIQYVGDALALTPVLMCGAGHHDGRH